MASTGEPVQLWDCSEFSQPTCKQNPEGEAVQTRLAPGEPEEEHEEPVQTLCDACEAEEAAQDEQAGPAGEPVQAMGDPEEAETAETAEATEAAEASEATEAPEAAEADDEPVQARCAACETEAAEPRQEDSVQEDGPGPSPSRNPALIHQEARRGLGNASQPLPHADRIQAAFGHHDISQVRAAVGGAAETANRRMGALAFASGDRIAFRQTPDLRLVAHEAAHVVQQREGLALPGNVGQPGDCWERHADSVADAVAAGRSAQDLLDQVAQPAAARGGLTAADVGAAKEPVQSRLTSSAAHLGEEAPTSAEDPAAAALGGGDTAGAGAPPSDAAAPPDEAAMNTVAEGDESGAPPPAAGEGGSPQETVGSPVPQGVSTKLERRLGEEQEHVQLEQSPEASLAAGSDAVSRAPDGNKFSFMGSRRPGIDFAAGENRPNPIEGRGQMEHNLTHVVQQSVGRDTDHVREPAVRRGGMAQVTPVPQGGIQFKGVAEFFEEQAWVFVRDHFPDVEPYLRNPGKLWTSLVDGVGEVIGGLVNRVVSPLRGFHPVNSLKGLFGPLLAAAVTAFKTKDCVPFFAALNGFKAKISAFTAGPLATLKAKFASIKKTIQSALKKVTAPFARMLEQVGGTLVSFVRGLATRIGGLIKKAREWSARAVTWVQNKLGFGEKGSEEGIWDLIKHKASEVWEKAKPKLLPFVGPLKTAATVIAALSPFGPVLAAIKYGPKLAAWLGGVYGLLHVPERITSARAAIARTLPTIAGKLAQGALALTGIPLAIDSLRGAATALESLSTSLTGVPVLGLAGSAAKFLATKITEGVTWVGGPVKTATHVIETGLKDAGAWLEKVGRGAGRLVGLAANPFGIVGFLAGEFWLAIPGCFKLPILNWILDLLIGLVRAIPANPLLGPLFPLFLHGVVGFLLRVRNGGDGDEKEKVSDRLARLATGSASFVLGLTVGVVKGVGEGLLMPFTLVYDLITAIPKIVDFVNGLPSKLASGLAGLARSVADTADEAIAGFWPAVTKALNTPGGGILQWLNKAWGALSAGSEGIGGSVAGALIGFIMLGDFELGEKLGWVAGTVLFEVVLAFLTGGATVLLKSASVPLRMLGKVLRVVVKAHEIMNQVFGLIFKALEPALNGIKKILQSILPSLESKVGAILKKFEALIGSAKTAGEEFAGRFAGDEALALARAAEGKGAAALATAEGAGTKAEGEVADDAASAAARDKPTDVDIPTEKPSAPKVEEPAPTAQREPTPAPEPAPKAAETPGQTPETAKPIEAPPRESAAARERNVAESGTKESVELTEKQLGEELEHLLDNPRLMEGAPPKRTAKIGDHTWHENPNGAWCRRSTEVCVRLPADRAAALSEAQIRLEAAEKRAQQARARADEARARHGGVADDLAGWEAEVAAAQAKIAEQEARIAAMREGTVAGDVAAAERDLARLRKEAADFQEMADSARNVANDAAKIADDAGEALAKTEDRAQFLAKKQAEHASMAAEIDALEAKRRALIVSNRGVLPPTGSELGKELLRIESEIKALQQKLGADMYVTRGLTPEVKADLRKGTPPKVGSKERNDLLDSMTDEFGQVNGKVIDPATGLPLERVYVDHVVPFEEIVQMEGFNQLTRAQQLEILNLRANLMPQSAAMSSSKLNRSMAEFFEKPVGRTIPIERRAGLLQREREAREALKKAIQEQLAR